MRIRVPCLLVALVAAAVTVTVPAEADTSCGFPPVLNAQAPSLHPEGVAYDPTRRAFLVSSVRHGTVSVVRADGSVRTLISDPRMISTLGIKVDVARHRILVAHADLGIGERTSPDTAMRHSGLGVFDLRTGKALRFADLAAAAGPGLHAANDLAVGPDGTAYVTDPLSDALLRVDVDGRASVLVRDPRFHDATQPTSFGLNGIVRHPNGYLLAVKSWGGEVFRIGTGKHPVVSQVAVDQPVHNGDGLLLRTDGSLLAVTNPLGPQGVSAVRVLRSGDGWSSARTTTLLPWPDEAPTTATRTPSGDYVLDGRLGVIFGGSLSDEFTLRRVPST